MKYTQWHKLNIDTLETKIRDNKYKIESLKRSLKDPASMVKYIISPSEETKQLRIDQATKKLNHAETLIPKFEKDLEDFRRDSVELWKHIEEKINSALRDLQEVLDKHGMTIGFDYEGDSYGVYDERIVVELEEFNFPIKEYKSGTIEPNN